MPALGEYTNVYDTALEVLRSKGYRLWRDTSADMICAEKDGWDFMADGPISLLGLIAIFEHSKPDHYEEYWWKKEGPLSFRKLPTQAPAYVPVWKKA